MSGNALPPIRAIGQSRFIFQRAFDRSNRRLGGQPTSTTLVDLFESVTHINALRASMDVLDQDGPKAAGPDRVVLSELDTSSRWRMARVLNQSLVAENYRPSRGRIVSIPKGIGRGNRQITVLNLADQVVQKSVATGLEPLIDPTFSDNSFGFRPGLSREHALARAIVQVNQGRRYWIVADIRDAFNNVPLERLMQAIEARHRPSERMLGLIRAILGISPTQVGAARNPRIARPTRGIPQGGSLSPILLNIYLDHFLDKVWLANSTCPLLRFADDITVCCRDSDEARSEFERLNQQIVSAGFSLKSPREESIFDMNQHHVFCNFLGYRVSYVQGRVSIGIPENSWTEMSAYFRELYRHPYPAVVATNAVRGIVQQWGPMWDNGNWFRHAYERLISTAEGVGFNELPASEQLEPLAQSARERFLEIQNLERSRQSPPNLVDWGIFLQ